jgi:hypothetical protein
MPAASRLTPTIPTISTAARLLAPSQLRRVGYTRPMAKAPEDGIGQRQNSGEPALFVRRSGSRAG